MKAIVYDEFGPPEVLRLAEVEKPSPKDHEILIKVMATGVTKYDCWVRSNTAPPGFGLIMRLVSGKTPKQRIIGTEVAGIVAGCGKDTTQFKIEDPVFGFTGMNLGAYAEYISLPEDAVASKPTNASFEESSSILQGALTAFYFLRQADIQPGQKILVYGASGGVGGVAVQIARHHFQAEVTGVCSAAKMDMVKSLGANHVIDYQQEDFTRNGEVYDVIFDSVGKSPVFRTRHSLKKNGWYLLATFGLTMLFKLFWLSKTSRLHVVFGALKETNDDLLLIKDLVESGVIHPVIDRCFPLSQASEAHRYVESGQKKGSVVLKVGDVNVS